MYAYYNISIFLIIKQAYDYRGYEIYRIFELFILIFN